MKILKAIGKSFTALAGNIDRSVEQKILMSLARHAVTALGAYLVTKGVIDSGHTEAFIGGLLTAIAAISGSKQKIDVDRDQW